MRRLASTLVVIAAALGLLVSTLGDGAWAPARPSRAAPPPDVVRDMALTPNVAFVPNLGQWPGGFRYRARIGLSTVFLDEAGWTLSLLKEPPPPLPTDPLGGLEQSALGEEVCGAAVRMRFVGASTAEMVPEKRLGGVHNYFLGNDPARWRSGVPRHGAVSYRRVYPGIDMRAYSRESHFEYDLLLRSGADLAQVEIQVEGAEGLSIDASGALVIETAVGTVRQPRPVTWELGLRGERRVIAAEHALRGALRFGFVAPDWSGENPLLLDPGLLYGTFVGGTQDDRATAMSVDAAGVVTMAGYTYSSDFPTSPGAFSTSLTGPAEACVVRLDPAQPGPQQLIYSTYLGGSGLDRATAMSVDGMGVVTVVGWTGSTDFPCSPGAMTQAAPAGANAFIAQLATPQAGSQQLIYGTYLGGTSGDTAHAICANAGGALTVLGTTGSPDFPSTPGAFDVTFGGQGDAFLARIDPLQWGAQQLLYCTFLGGSNSESGNAVAMVGSQVTVAGETQSTDFPTTTGALSASYSGIGDAFVARLDLALSGSQQLVYGTYLGGGGADRAYALAVDNAGVVTVVGHTWSSGFPTTPGAFDTTLNAPVSGYEYDAFVTRLDPSQSGAQQLLYGTFLGGLARDSARAVSNGSGGLVAVAGFTYSADFPTSATAFDTSYNGPATSLSPGGDAFLAVLDTALTGSQQLVSGTFLGGSADDHATAVGVAPSGMVSIVGGTNSPDFPVTPGAFATTLPGAVPMSACFLVQLGLVPPEATVIGTGCAGTAGLAPILAATQLPSIGNAGFGLQVTQAASGAPLWLFLADGIHPSPLALGGLGCLMYLDAQSLSTLISAGLVPVGPLMTDPTGFVGLSLPIPARSSLYGSRAALQAAVVDYGSPLGFTVTNALDCVIR